MTRMAEGRRRPGPSISASRTSTSPREPFPANGGAIHYGPAEVPGGSFIIVASDPQGALFGLVGPRKPGG